jgi:hypothetical protein
MRESGGANDACRCGEGGESSTRNPPIIEADGEAVDR